jgi:hypothetical protein
VLGLVPFPELELAIAGRLVDAGDAVVALRPELVEIIVLPVNAVELVMLTDAEGTVELGVEVKRGTDVWLEALETDENGADVVVEFPDKEALETADPESGAAADSVVNVEIGSIVDNDVNEAVKLDRVWMVWLVLRFGGEVGAEIGNAVSVKDNGAVAEDVVLTGPYPGTGFPYPAGDENA